MCWRFLYYLTYTFFFYTLQRSKSKFVQLIAVENANLNLRKAALQKREKFLTTSLSSGRRGAGAREWFRTGNGVKKKTYKII